MEAPRPTHLRQSRVCLQDDGRLAKELGTRSIAEFPVVRKKKDVAASHERQETVQPGTDAHIVLRENKQVPVEALDLLSVFA